VAYSVNRCESLREIHPPSVIQVEVASKGYMGHDEFAVVASVLVQRFPVYDDTDTNAKPTWGTGQLYYKLVPGEAGWILKVDKVVECWLHSRTKGSDLAVQNPSLQCTAFGRR
jgi:hypothetical protein